MTRSWAPEWAFRAMALAAAFALVFAMPHAADGNEGPERLTPDGGTPDLGQLADDPVFADELWFVEFAAEPTARGGNVSAMARERDQLRREARAADIDFEERLDFRRLWNGMSVRATASEASALAELPGAVAVYPMELVEAPEPQGEVDPDLATALGMTGADVARSELGFTGTGLSVAIIDTGIDYQHPDLGGDGVGTSFPTARVTHGFDYVGDDYDASDPERDTPQPDPDPMDVNGHGTHVAGIVGADAASEDGVTGVAPGVTFGAYKVFGTSGSSSADVIIAAMEDAHDDGMDVINMSLGAGLAWGDYPTSQVANQLVAEGTVVVASAGNAGADGLFSLGAPGNASDVIGVASADNLFMNAEVMEVEGLDVDGSDDLPYTGIGAAEMPPTEGESDPIVWVGRACPSEGDELLADPNGMTALVIRGDCTFEEKYATAANAGATGVIIYNNLPGLFAGGGIVAEEGVWAAATTNAHGTALRAMVEADPATVTATFTDRRIQVANPAGGLVSSFSSYGMTPDLQLRPDITAPGGLIESTYPLAAGAYATVSGTSMSAPHVAGGVALLLESQPGLDPLEVRATLQNTADPLVWSLNPGLGILDHTFRQGAGMMQIDQAITTTTSVSPSKIELGESEQVTTTLTVTNTGDEDVTYVFGHEGALGTGGFGDAPGDWYSIFDPLGVGAFAGPTTAAQFSEDSVTVSAGDTTSVEVTIANPDVGLYAHQAGGYLTITEEGADGPSAVVPFAGLAGEIADIELWPAEREAVVGLDNLVVARWVEDEDGDEVLTLAEPGHVFRPNEEPVAAVFMGFAAERVEVTAVHESGYEVPVAEVEFARRSVGPNEYLPYTWDGREQVGNTPARRPAPQGEWHFQVDALMPRVSPDAPEVWVSETTYSFVKKGGPRIKGPRVPGPPSRGGPNR